MRVFAMFLGMGDGAAKAEKPIASKANSLYFTVAAWTITPCTA